MMVWPQGSHILLLIIIITVIHVAIPVAVRWSCVFVFVFE